MTGPPPPSAVPGASGTPAAPAPASPPAAGPERWYLDREAAFAREVDAASLRSERFGVARLIAFAAVVLAVAWWIAAPDARRPFAVAASILAAVVFAALVGIHARVRLALARARGLVELNRRGAARVRRDWDALPSAHLYALPAHPYALDLDVVGEASLARLVDVTSAAPGRGVLAHWLLDPPPAPVAEIVRARQQAVRELAGRPELREELAFLAYRSTEMHPRDFERFLEWAAEPAWLLPRRAIVILSWLIPAGTVVTVVLAALRVLPWSVPLLCFLAGLFLFAAFARRLSATIAAVTARASGLRQQARMLALIERTPFEAPLLVQLRGAIAAGGGAPRALARLESALGIAEGRGGMVYATAQALLLWDFHVVARLERWRRSAGGRARGWLDALGEVEALAALATLAHDNPGWTYPDIQDTDRLQATALAHPLLPDGVRVANDVAVGPSGTLLLVTGSNMSGKSTLLRAIGLNAVLAQTGAPVCAARLTLPPLDVRTSIRVADSLERGISLFMAELRRLKEVVDAARQPEAGRQLLYLLDEILHGTNSAERRVAARAVLAHLVSSGAIGVVTTHDLALAAEGELVAAGVPVHFSDTVSQGPDGLVMTFDYRLRPGLATSTNALKLLEMVGL